MNLLKVIVLSTLAIGCSKRDPVPALAFDTTYTIYNPTTSSNGKRVYLIHGFRGDRSNYEHPAFKPFVIDLNANGFEVITFDIPYTYPDYFNHDGGASYRAKYEAQLRTIEAQVDVYHGVKTNIIGGFSFGGLHSMMGQVLAPDLFTAYFAILPVVHMDAVLEMQGTVAPLFSPMNEASNLALHKGLISWGTNDLRVNYQYSIDLANLINSANLTTISYPGLRHETTPQVVSDTLNFVLSL